QGGQGRLEVLNGGTVMSVDVANIGNGSESSGEVLVSGNRSSWTHVGDLTVGHNGEGQLEITNRGAVHVDKAIVVGATGKGILTISNGGEVSVGADEDIWLAMNTNSEGVL